MTELCYLDMDGVVADFTAGWTRLHDVPNPFDDPTFRGEDAWNCVPDHIPSAEFWGKMGFAFWRDLPKTEEADDIVALCLKKFGYGKVCFLTSPVSTAGCLEGKAEWADRNYPAIPLILARRPKRMHEGLTVKHFLANRNGVLIDDHTPNIRNWEAGGGHGVLVPRPWNQDYPHSHCVVQAISSKLGEIERNSKVWTA